MKRSLYFLSGLSFFLWWGGFTFYASFVVSTGMKVLGNHVLMGFITQQVSVILNVVCATALLINILYLFVFKTSVQSRLWKWASINLLILCVWLTALYILHGYMDTFLDVPAHKLNDEPHFYMLHRAYLLTSSVMWLQGIFHLYNYLRYNPQPE